MVWIAKKIRTRPAMTKFDQLTDAQWDVVQKLMNWEPPPQRGTPRSDLRKVWNSILYVTANGCRWADLPVDTARFVPRSTAHKWLKQFQSLAILDRVLAGLLRQAVTEGKLDLSHVAVDGSFSPCTRRRAERCAWL